MIICSELNDISFQMPMWCHCCYLTGHLKADKHLCEKHNIAVLHVLLVFRNLPANVKYWFISITVSCYIYFKNETFTDFKSDELIEAVNGPPHRLKKKLMLLFSLKSGLEFLLCSTIPNIVFHNLNIQIWKWKYETFDYLLLTKYRGNV